MNRKFHRLNRRLNITCRCVWMVNMWKKTFQWAQQTLCRLLDNQFKSTARKKNLISIQVNVLGVKVKQEKKKSKRNLSGVSYVYMGKLYDVRVQMSVSVMCKCTCDTRTRDVDSYRLRELTAPQWAILNDSQDYFPRFIAVFEICHFTNMSLVL